MGSASRGSGRPPTFGPNDVLAAAVSVIDQEGVSKCTLRAVARELDVTPMALYRHIDSKDDLLERVPDYLAADIVSLVGGAIDGVGALRQVAVGLTAVLEQHPRAAPLFSQPRMGPHMRETADIVVERFEVEGVSRLRAGGLLRATVALVVGLFTGGGQTAEVELGAVAQDAIEIWLSGVALHTDSP